MAKQLLVESIRIDGQTQSRERINADAVAEYAEAMKAQAGSAGPAPAWPPVVVFWDGREYWLADGFHRVLAARSIGRKNIAADVRQGSREDAAWASCAANQTHGLRRSNADKRKAVEIALRLHSEMTDRAIAGHCGLSHPFVAEIRRQVVTVTTSGPRQSRVGRDGKNYPPPQSRSKTGAAQGPGSRPEFTAGQGLGPPPRPEERPGFVPAAGSTPGQMQGVTGYAEESHAVTGAATVEAAGKTGRTPDYLVDDLGRRIPEDRLPLWGRRQEVQDMLTALSRVRVALREAQDNRDPLFSEVPFSSALAHLDQAYNAVQVAKPYAVCAFCQGHGCNACGQRGLLGKFRWDTVVPKEHKEAVARLIEKEQRAGVV